MKPIYDHAIAPPVRESFQMTTALLIGGTGFIGRNLAAMLLAQGHAVFTTGRPRSMASAGFEPGRIALDLRDDAEVAKVLDQVKPDIVFHLACNLLPASTTAHYLIERRELIDPSIKLAERLAQDGTRLVYLSSGGTVYGSTVADRMAETDECQPISVYGQAKLEFENYLRFAGRVMGLRYLIIRPSNPFGRHQSPHGNQGLIAILIGKALRGEPLEVWGDGLVVRDYIYVDDLCDAIHHLIGSDIRNDVFNIGSGIGHSLLDVVAAVERAVDRKIELAFRPPRPVDVRRAVLDISKLRATGARPPRPLQEGIDAFVATLEPTA